MFKKEGKPKPVALIGVLLLLVVVIATGCSSQQTSSGTQNQSQTTQANQGQRQSNPAVKATRDITRLQQNTQTVFTSDQVSQLKPLLQALIDTSNPTSDFLQAKADSITAIFTEQQKTALTQKPSGNKPQQNASSNSSSSQSNTDSANSTNSTKGSAPSNNLEPKTIYQQALDALSK
ncbi:hypothetical protein [Desulfitobacterium sp.]|uniref:hypothetical protein n=1 Tax=Desulfitobacterium sp. TaxID=49981 RepID=UPI002BEB80A4|nr:hypothetical protein [Desulfitobacterium sp.]HVJ49290.1 hypothetical protein [Desulfitobacterium sp.]